MALAGAVAAGVTAGAAYLDGKYHLRKDLSTVISLKLSERRFAKAAKANGSSLWYFFEEQARRLTTEPCLWYRETPAAPPISMTWTETYDSACCYANFMLAHGVKPGELVAVYLQNSTEFMCVTLASWAIGCAPAMMNYNLGGDGLIHCLRLSGTKIVLVDADSECRARIEDQRARIEGELAMRIIVLDHAQKDAIAALPPTRPGDEYRADVTGDSPFCLLYTSGTTGFPKALPFQLKRCPAFASPRLLSTGLRTGPNSDVWYNCMPLYHGTGFTNAVSAMITGLTLAIGRRFSVRNFWPDIRDSKANAFVYVGETARYLLAAPRSDGDKQHSVRVMFGNGLRPDVWKRFQDRFGVGTVVEFFSSTEGMFNLQNRCRGPFHEAHVGHHGLMLRSMRHNTYVPVAIDHDTGGIWRDPSTGFAKRQKYEEGGEMLVRVPSEKAFIGYWNAPDASAKKFVRDVFAPGDLFYRTGDALRRDREGRWYFMDRLGDTFRWKSENVSTAEVAECLGRFPGLVEANVYGVEIPGHEGRAGCAAVYIPPAERAGFPLDQLLAHARTGLPKYAVPVFLRVVGDMAPMHNNKQNKVPLRKEGVDFEKIRNGSAGPEDAILWLKPGGSTYEAFSEEDYQSLVAGKARL